eukprot:jgi/Mesen1/6085/ME000031S05356
MDAVTEVHTRSKASGVLHKGSFKEARASTDILDLPTGVLERILRLSCAEVHRMQGGRRGGGISMTQIKCMSSVCTRWRDVVRCSYTRIRCDSLGDVDVAVSQLRSFGNVTHASVSIDGHPNHPKFLRQLVRRLPLLTSFHLNLGSDGRHTDLAPLSYFLHMKTNIRELYVRFEYKDSGTYYWDQESYWRWYLEAMERLNFNPQVHLKKLTLDFSQLRFSMRHSCCIPVSTTLRGLTNLEELHILVNPSSWESKILPHWLAELPAFVGVHLLNCHYNCSTFLDSLGKMTGLKELAMTGRVFDASKMDVVSRLSRLTSLELDIISYQAAPAREPLHLSSTLRKLSCNSELLPRVRGSLPLLEELKLTKVGSEASRLTYFALTPNVCFLHLTLLARKGAWPHLEHLAGLTSLILEPCWQRSHGLGPKDYIWHMCAAQTPALQVLELHSCELLGYIDGLLALERCVATSLRCTCRAEHGPWFSSHAEYVAGGSVCRRLPADAAGQLFKGTRRPTAKSPEPCPICLTFRNPISEVEGNYAEEDDDSEDYAAE